MNNLTSIINSFESGRFYANRNYSRIFDAGAPDQLNDVLLWTNANVTPGILHDKLFLNSNNLSQCRDLAVALQKRFSDIVGFLNKTLEVLEERSYLSRICGNPTCFCVSNGCGFWRNLQEHESIEADLILKSKAYDFEPPVIVERIHESIEADLILKSKAYDFLPPVIVKRIHESIEADLILKSKAYDFEPPVIVKRIHESIEADLILKSKAYDFEPPVIVERIQNILSEISVTPVVPANNVKLETHPAVAINDLVQETLQSECSNCDCNKKDFKFNFNIDHNYNLETLDHNSEMEYQNSETTDFTSEVLDNSSEVPDSNSDITAETLDLEVSTVKTSADLNALLYGNEFIEEIRTMNLKIPTIQFRTDKNYACLLCSTDSSYGKSYTTIFEHIKGQRHKKYNNPNAINALAVYHKIWMKFDVAYQAHQAYFYPVDQLHGMCYICRVYVPYKILQYHINSVAHMGYVLRAFKQDRRSILMKLQRSVYVPKLLDTKVDSNNDNFTIEVKKNIPNLMDINLNDENSTIKIKKSLPNLMDINLNDDNSTIVVKPSKQQVITNAVTQNLDSESALPDVILKNNGHDVVESITSSSGNTLDKILEHRFLNHLQFLEVFQKGVRCTCCQVLLPYAPQDIKVHLWSSLHSKKSHMNNINWRFHCEICDYRCSREETWSRHLEEPKHIERFNQIVSSRKTIVIEYQCSSCQMIIFGDDISLKRHCRAQRGRKKKEIVLTKELKDVMKSSKFVQNLCDTLVDEANNSLQYALPIVNVCCAALEEALREIYTQCKVYPFGSRVSGLGNAGSDLDVFVDCGGMYLGTKGQDAYSQEQFVNAACKIFRARKKEFSDLNSVPTARTPIVQIYHKASNIDCDLSFRHGLSVENTKFLRFCLEVQPVTQALILFLKKWISLCALNEDINTYALSMLVIFFMQAHNYLLPAHALKMLNPKKIIFIDGWSVCNTDNLHQTVEQQVRKYNNSIRLLLIEFFQFYHKFDHSNYVVCPLLGYPVKKSSFLDPSGKDGLPKEMMDYIIKLKNPNAEEFRARSQFCIQDPFDLSHNLAKAWGQAAINKFLTYCDLSVKHLGSIQ